jgi:hypothetical protein
MANRMYPKGKIAAYSKKFDLLTDPVKLVLIDLADYTPNFATDELLTAIPPAAIVGTAVALTGKTLLAGPSGDKIKFSSAGLTLTSVTGDTSEALLGYAETGTGSYLLFLDDTATGTPGLPITPSGVNIAVTCPVDGWFNY